MNKRDNTPGLPETYILVEVDGTGLSVLFNLRGHVTKDVIEFKPQEAL